jgi:hypothetical protein
MNIVLPKPLTEDTTSCAVPIYMRANSEVTNMDISLTYVIVEKLVEGSVFL